MPKHPGLALLISGKLDHDKEMKGASKEDAELDAMNHLIDCIHDKHARDAVDCLKDLLEILDSSESDSKEKEEEDEEESDEPSLY